MTTTIIIEAMGGDLGPAPVLSAVANLSQQDQPVHFMLVGEQEVLQNGLNGLAHDKNKIGILHSPEWIRQDEKPGPALQQKPKSSILLAMQALAAGRGQVLVSAGNSGAILLAAAQKLKRLEHVRRAALAAVYPTQRLHGRRRDPFALLLDVGATLEVEAQDLLAFALMGAAYASLMSDNPRPRVALLSNGREAEKGPAAIVAAHRILRQDFAGNPSFEFIGNVEGLDIPKGQADVVVTGGFVGNVALKMLEGIGETVLDIARYAYRQKLSWKVALLLLRSGLRQIKASTDWQQYGGAPILGFDKLCIKAHGRSGERAMRNAIKLAARASQHNFNGLLQKQLALLDK